MRDIDAAEVRAELAERIRHLFSMPRGEFNAVLFPAGPYEVPDEVGDGRPSARGDEPRIDCSYHADLREPPPDIAEIFEYKGTIARSANSRTTWSSWRQTNAPFRTCANWCAAASRLDSSKARIPTSHSPTTSRARVKAEYEKLKLDVAMAILQCYRHLFYPSSSRMTGAQLDLGHTIIELSGAGDSQAMDSIRWNGFCTSRRSCSKPATLRIRRPSCATRPDCE
jgi:hypothetical protein